MIQYINCTQASDSDLFKAFKEGFSDYMIKLDISLDFFLEHFFGPEGNSKEYSWLAMDGDRPVGLVLGGIRFFDGRKTLRCGTMCVIPEYRKKGIASELIEKHMNTARKEQCGQLFLECIIGNDRALNFYRKMGYRKEYDLSYFSCENPEAASPHISVEALTIEELKELRSETDVHINWQNDIPYLEMNKPEILGIREKGNAVAVLVCRESKIHLIYVKKAFRGRGYATAMLTAASSGKDKITTSFSNSSMLTGFFLSRGFKEEKISQAEMYRLLPFD